MGAVYTDAAKLLNTRDPAALIFTAVAFAFISTFIGSLSTRLAGADKDDPARSLNQLTALGSGLCGWILGILFTPYTPPEATQFAALSSVVSAFLAGYAISKLDRFLEK